MKNHYRRNMSFSWILLLFVFTEITSGQDLECKSSNLCTEIIVVHTIQLKSMCPYLYIRFRNMTEETLTVGSFRQCHETAVLDLSNNKIRTIKAGAFLGLNALRELYLANNRIEKIEPGTFHTLTDLQVFVLAGNKLKALPEYEFTSKSIRYFNINNNQIPKMPATALLNLREVDLVDLSINNMEYINPNSLINLSPGGKIILSNNFLTNISMHFNATTATTGTKGHGVSKNTILDASGNAITILSSSVLGQLYKLNISVLDLAFNYITKIEPTTFHLYKNLQELHLSHNRIKLLNNEFIMHLPHLNGLDLSYNQLTKSIFAMQLPESVIYLNYSHNRIEEYTYNHWSTHPTRKAITLDISNNRINYIDPNRFCKFVEHINIAYNKWSCPVLYNVVRNLEMRNIHVETDIDYQGNNIKGIPCELETDKRNEDQLEGFKAIWNDSVTETDEGNPYNASGASSYSSDDSNAQDNSGSSSAISLNMKLIFFIISFISIVC